MSAEEARRTGARAKDSKRSLSSIERKRRMYGRVAMASTLVGAGVVAWHMGREWDSEKEKERLGRDVTEEAGLIGRWQRGRARFMDTLDVSVTEEPLLYAGPTDSVLPSTLPSTSTSQPGILYFQIHYHLRIKNHTHWSSVWTIY